MACRTGIRVGSAADILKARRKVGYRGQPAEICAVSDIVELKPLWKAKPTCLERLDDAWT